MREKYHVLSEGKMQNFDYCVFIGRFSPFHKAHQAILNKALSVAKKVIIVIGSSNTSRTIKNPWSANERQEMIKSCLSSDDLQKVSFVQMGDYLYNDNLWISTLQSKINDITDYSDNVALIGHESDESSYYLKLFPQYKSVSYAYNPDFKFHANKVRELYFAHDASYKPMLPEKIVAYLDDFKNTQLFANLKQEKEFLDNYKELWRGAPFPPTFMTVDSVVIKSGHILVVTRRSNPGKGLLALPGGFLNQNEKLQDAALRELKEETAIKMSVVDLKKSIIASNIFDEPQRSLRGRTITTAYLLNLGTGPLPAIKGGDDAEKAQWLPLSDFYSMSSEFFEDHWHIINYFVSKF